MKEFLAAFIFAWILALLSTYPVGAEWAPLIHPTAPCLSATADCVPLRDNETHPETYRIDPTLPGLSVRDRTRPSVIIHRDVEGNEFGYPTLPGLDVRDRTRPGYIIERLR